MVCDLSVYVRRRSFGSVVGAVERFQRMLRKMRFHTLWGVHTTKLQGQDINITATKIENKRRTFHIFHFSFHIILFSSRISDQRDHAGWQIDPAGFQWHKYKY